MLIYEYPSFYFSNRSINIFLKIIIISLENTYYGVHIEDEYSGRNAGDFFRTSNSRT